MHTHFNACLPLALILLFLKTLNLIDGNSFKTQLCSIQRVVENQMGDFLENSQLFLV